MTAPVYIASKQRPDAPVFALLRESGIRPLVLVEPQERALYAAPDYDVAELAENDRGLAYARQAALNIARAAGTPWYWMLDDDIRTFARADPSVHRNVPITATEALGAAEDARDGCNAVRLGIVALEYAQYAWNARAGAIGWGSYCDCAVLINTATTASYRESLPLKVDRDFTLQVLAHGLLTARLRDVSFQVPRNGSNAGGLHDRYADGIEARASRRMAELWPDVCEPVTKPGGRPDVKIHWRRVRQLASAA